MARLCRLLGHLLKGTQFNESIEQRTLVLWAVDFKQADYLVEHMDVFLGELNLLGQTFEVEKEQF